MASFRLIAIILALLPVGAAAERLVIFAAASLAPALEKVVDAWGGDAVISPAGSSVLARQINFGAPADIFVSANVAWMDTVAERIVPGTRMDIAGNRLVVIGPAGSSPAPVAEALNQGRVAMGLLNAVPVGLYGAQALDAMGLWSDVAPRVVQVDNARAALALVVLGEAPRAIVYATDALAEPRVTVIASIPSDSHAPIRYPAAALSDSAAARDLLAFLASPAGQAILRTHGFTAP